MSFVAAGLAKISIPFLASDLTGGGSQAPTPWGPLTSEVLILFSIQRHNKEAKVLKNKGE